MPYAVTSDKVKLHYEEVGQGTPILFVHEFASDHRGWEPQMRLFGKQPVVSRVSDLEYRTCAAASRAEAKTAAQRLMGLRQTAWRRRMDIGWAARHPG